MHRVLPVLLILAASPLRLAAAETQPRPDRFDPIVYQQFALQHAGETSKGRELFETHASLACTNCHRITGMEKSGPNLDGIGDKYSRAEIIDHLLSPSDFIKPGYQQAVIRTQRGQILNGRLERATKLGVRLLTPTGQQLDLDAKEIEELHYSELSLMPNDLVSSISPSQFADLIAYLQTLRFGIKTGLTNGGQVVSIPRLATPIGLTPIHPEHLAFENPVWCGALPGRPGELIVVEHQTARVWRFIPDAQHPRKELFLDLSAETHISGNQGVMCIAFHPDYPANGRYFLEHEVQEAGQVKTTIVERRAGQDRLVDSGKPSLRLLEVNQPAYNHNGGCIAFGGDGMLYAAFGDGGPQRDPPGYSQNPRILLGSMVRIDVDTPSGEQAYRIPPDNPFWTAHRNDPTIRAETWAIGFREPWRFSFDARTGDLWLGDVGQDDFEEVAIIRRGENHGWNVREAYAPFSDEHRRADETYTEPLFAYAHGLGFSVTGGYVYRGASSPSFDGVYIFGDYNTRRIWGLRQRDGVLRDVRELGTAPGGIASFGVDHQGELLLVTYGGTIYQLDLSKTEYR